MWWKIWPHNGWVIERRDGSEYSFICGYELSRSCSWIGFRDAQGNTLELTRDENANLLRVEGRNGAAIELTYDDRNRATRARAGLTRWVNYTYDAAGRLITVEHVSLDLVADALSILLGRRPAGPRIARQEYTYDDEHHMVTMREPWGLLVTNTYDDEERCIHQILSDGQNFEFKYTEDAAGRIARTDVVRADGSVRRVVFDADRYAVSDTWPLGARDQVNLRYERDPVSKRLEALAVSCSIAGGTRARLRAVVPPGANGDDVKRRLMSDCLSSDAPYSGSTTT